MKFKNLKPNYRKKVIQIELNQGRKKLSYQLPFAVFSDLKITSQNRFTSLEIDKELNNEAVNFTLEDGSKGDFAVDFVLYHCEPSYDWSPINQVKKVLQKKLKKSQLSYRVLADAMKTSPSQIMRLLTENKTTKQWTQLATLAQLLGYQLNISLKK